MKIYNHKSKFGWDNDNGLGEILIQQIINGIKTATCSFKTLYTERELQELYETRGKVVTVIDHRGKARCNIRITDIFETTFGNPDVRLVMGEGVGKNVSKFQHDHRNVWNQVVKGTPLTDETILIAELFKLVEVAE